MIATIESIHAAYCEATGQPIRLAFDRERSWYDFIQAGFTEADVRFMADWIKRKILKGERNPGALKFSNMIERVDRFEEDLVLARAEMRNFKAPPSEKDKVIKAFRPEQEPVKQTAKPAREIVNQLVDDLRKAVNEI